MALRPTICRFCHAHCGVLVETRAGRPVRVTGDRRNPIYRGFTCAKGRELPRQHAHPERLLHSLARRSDGGFAPIASEQAVREVATRVDEIVRRHGPRSVALYLGTYSGTHPASALTSVGFVVALGSPMVFTANTIDQPGKSIANALHGRWLGGGYQLHEADSWLFVGTNPLISMSGGISANPGRALREARQRGLSLVVVDPRRTEVARLADVFLQPRPGEDPTLLAAMLHVILREGLHDPAFVEAEVAGFEALARAVEPFDPVYAARRADVPAEDIARAARLFAAGRRGGAIAGTGPNMAGRGNLTEYLLLCLDSVCGYWRRAGEVLPNPGALLPPALPRAQAQPPRRAFGYGEKLRVRGLGNAACGLPTAALADEILLEGEGRVRALFCVGSNPLAAWPDQHKTLEALRALDLLVTLDIKLSATSKLAHYVIAPKLSLEVPGLSLFLESLEQTYVGMGYPAAYAQYTPALVDPPPGADLIEEWEFFYELARQLRLPLRLHPLRPEAGVLRETREPIDLDPERKPTGDEILEIVARGSRVSLEAVKRHPHGAVFAGEPVRVAPRAPDCDARLDVGNPVLLGELAEVRAERGPGDALAPAPGAFPFRLISRRLPNVYNSSGRDLPAHTRRYRHNPAFVHPEDLAALGLAAGDVVRIASDHASILGVVEAAPELRRGVVSMAHGFGDAPEHDGELLSIGSNTGRLVPVDRDYDPYSGIPRMSGVPVRLERYLGSLAPS